MTSLNQPIEQLIASLWARIPQQYRRAAPWIFIVGVLCYGFEMTNLSLHHDDIVQFFDAAEIGHDVGRYGYGWVHHYIEREYYSPFFQVFLGITALTIYALCVAASWKIDRTLDTVLVGSTVVAFPYLAQVYSYNTAVLPYSIAHASSAAAVLLCLNFTLRRFVVAAVLMGFALSIYQSVIGNATALVCFAAVISMLTPGNAAVPLRTTFAKTFVTPLLGIFCGGLLYIALVAMLGLPTNDNQGADKAFTLDGGGADIGAAIPLIIQGTRSFLFWPENYFPADLKVIQLGLIIVAAAVSLFAPVSFAKRAVAGAFAICAVLAPRTLQFLHAEATYHNLTLTAYGLVVAGAVMLALRARSTLWRNLVCAIAAVLVFKFVMLSNWISTVNYLNFSAHQSVMTQILTRIRDLPPASITRPEVVVVGSLKMPNRYPFLPQTGIATDYIDLDHLGAFSTLMKQPVTFVGAEKLTQHAQELARAAPIWPAPGSVFSADGSVIIVLSR